MSKSQRDFDEMYNLKWKRGVIDCSDSRKEDDIVNNNIRGLVYKSIVEVCDAFSLSFFDGIYVYWEYYNVFVILFVFE